MLRPYAALLMLPLFLACEDPVADLNAKAPPLAGAVAEKDAPKTVVESAEGYDPNYRRDAQHKPHSGRGTPPPPLGMAPPNPNGPKGADRQRLRDQRAFELAGHAESIACPEGEDIWANVDLSDSERKNIQILMENHSQIQREITPLVSGMRTENRSDDKSAAQALKDHVQEMRRWAQRVKSDPPTDPLYGQWVNGVPKITQRYQEVDNGIRTEYLGNDTDIIALIHAHAQLIDKYLKDGAPRVKECYKTKITSK